MNAKLSLCAEQAPSTDAVLPAFSSMGGYGPERKTRG